MSAPQVLRNLRVVELGELISAACCARLLAEYGAEVIKVERPGAGDLARRHGPFPGGQPDPERSGLFLFVNMNKLGITLDIATREGHALLLGLLRRADVLVHNYLPQTLEALGLAYERLRRINPALVLTSVTAFGHEGPYSRYKTYPINASAAAGAAHRIGRPDRYPIAMPYSRSEYWGGMTAAGGTMLALHVRRRTGRGQHVDISSVEAINTLSNGIDTVNYVDTGSVTRRHGIRTPISYPYVILPCKDGYYGLIIANQNHWDRFIELMGSPAWAKGPRYQDRVAMGHDYPEEVDALIKPWLARYTKKEVWAMFRAAKIPWHPIVTIDEVMDWEQHRYRGYWRRVPGATGHGWTVPGHQFRLLRAPACDFRPPPRLGQHNDQVFRGLLGRSERDMAALRSKGVV